MLTRRQFLLSCLTAIPLGGIYSRYIEPSWINLPKYDLTENPQYKFIHFTDTHFKGDPRLFEYLISFVNSSDCDFAVFTGDLIELKTEEYLAPALELIERFKKPIFGIPGNHDIRSKEIDKRHKAAFQSTGGNWLLNEDCSFKNIDIYGVDHLDIPKIKNPLKKNILLAHFPMTAGIKSDSKYDIICSGHSHGGQIRLPLIGAPYLPFGVGKFDKGFYQTENGKLYVNVGLGTFLIDVRFLCRPEIATFSI